MYDILHINSVIGFTAWMKSILHNLGSLLLYIVCLMIVLGTYAVILFLAVMSLIFGVVHAILFFWPLQ